MEPENSGSGASAVSSVGLRVACWGARGSVPSPGRSTARVGGNTSCVEVRTDDGRCFIFDGGTGIRPLGHRLTGEPETGIDLFLTHFHWDHIQGLPFFAPLYDAARRLRVHGAQQGAIGVRDLFAGQMREAYFPVPFEALRSHLEFVQLDGVAWEDGGVRVDALRVCHPGETFGYRLRRGPASVAFVPDNEIAMMPPDHYAALVDFVAGADVLFHDAMYTPDEYHARRGWGHSTHREAVELATRAGVRRLHLFHHAPDRTDDELFRLLDELRSGLARAGSDLELSVAAEGEELIL